MPEQRYVHTLNVEREALALAERWQVDGDQAMRAGLLHDCAKGLTLAQMQALVVEGGLRMDKEMWESRALLHAPVGAYLAQRDFDIEDTEVLDAIRWHTTGHAHMTTLEQIIYIADMVEPARQPFAALESIRECMGTDLREAMRLALRSTVEYIENRKCALYVDTLRALAWFEERR